MTTKAKPSEKPAATPKPRLSRFDKKLLGTLGSLAAVVAEMRGSMPSGTLVKADIFLANFNELKGKP